MKMKKAEFETIYQMLTNGESSYNVESSELGKLIEKLEKIQETFGVDFSINDSAISFPLVDLNLSINISIFDIDLQDTKTFFQATQNSIDFVEETLSLGESVEECINHEGQYEIIDYDFLEDVNYCYWKLIKNKFTPPTT